MTLLAKRYAAALFALAEKDGAIDAIAADLLALHGEFEADGQPRRETRALLTSPDVGAQERGVVLEKLGHDRHKLVQNLIGVLDHRRRLEVLFDIYPAFRALVLQHGGEVEGVVETPHPIESGQLDELTAVAGKLTGKKVSLTVREVPDLLGGVRLRVGNVLYDGSMKAALEQLQGQLMQASI